MGNKWVTRSGDKESSGRTGREIARTNYVTFVTFVPKSSLAIVITKFMYGQKGDKLIPACHLLFP